MNSFPSFLHSFPLSILSSLPYLPPLRSLSSPHSLAILSSFACLYALALEEHVFLPFLCKTTPNFLPHLHAHLYPLPFSHDLPFFVFLLLMLSLYEVRGRWKRAVINRRRKYRSFRTSFIPPFSSTLCSSFSPPSLLYVVNPILLSLSFPLHNIL